MEDRNSRYEVLKGKISDIITAVHQYFALKFVKGFFVDRGLCKPRNKKKPSAVNFYSLSFKESNSGTLIKAFEKQPAIGIVLRAQKSSMFPCTILYCVSKVSLKRTLEPKRDAWKRLNL